VGHPDIAGILKLPPEERLQLMELIWQSLSAKPSTIPLGDAHRAAIDQALQDHRENPDDMVSVAHAFAEVRKPR
jgi:putative addiction module component (TIGR02574 family)